MRYKVLKDFLGHGVGGNITLQDNEFTSLLLKDGYIEKEVKRWMPKEGETAYHIQHNSNIGWQVEKFTLDMDTPLDQNIFRSEATAQLVLDFIKEAFRQLHDPEINIGTGMYTKYQKARTAVLSDNNYDPN